MATLDVTANDFDLGGLLTDLCGGSLFGAEQLIVIRGPDKAKLLDGTAKNPSALTRALVARFESTQSTGGVVLAVDNLRADHKATKALVAAEGRVLSCRKLWDSPPPWDPDPTRTELAQWARARSSGSPRSSGTCGASCGQRLALAGTTARAQRPGW